LIAIQARLDSRRWPKKVLVDINGISMIDRVYEQCRLSEIRPVVIAVPAADTELIEHCQKRGYCVYQYGGDRNDLIGRYYHCLMEFGGERVLRITCDCPYHMPQEMIWVWMHGQIDDFTSNGWPEGRTVLDGADAECYSRRLLTWMNENITDPFEREHIPIHLYRNHEKLKDRFYFNRLDWPVNLSHIKTSIDSTADLDKMRKDGLI
jgi:spore coat polysaccharide biosynthesis protein SpsF (cytidylyltransferase family)